MDLIHSMRAFVRVIETGTFTRAAQTLELATGAVSRSVTELEAHLGVQLMIRSTRKLSLTEAGERFLPRAQKILAEIYSAKQDLITDHVDINGTLHIQSFASIAQHYILPAIASYRESHPKVNFELSLAQAMPDFYDGKTDMAVVAVHALPDSENFATKLGTTFSVLCASRSYVERHGEPKTPDELTNYDCLLLSIPTFAENQWLLEGPTGRVTKEVRGAVKVNIAESMTVAVREGLGIGMLPAHSVLDGLQDGSLVRILPDHVLQSKEIFAVFPSHRYMDKRTRKWLDFLKVRFQDALTADHARLQTLTGIGRHGLASRSSAFEMR
ncbi:LysR family transcriptional regulator [Burkholderia sp. A9]|uniref:LysR family transcriptional regulator n=1 Tax=Burkholderia sp. A9 TaxID=1365108 RepID=UPI0006942131|nr:LysR family transcriptional regulator [Burkholderia sp. A9]